MEEKLVLDLNSISEQCGLLENINAKIVTDKIDELAKIYSQDQLIVIYNNFLTLPTNPDVISHLIKCVEKELDESSLSPLILLLMQQDLPVNLRINCIKTIIKFKNTNAVEPLLYCLNNKDENYKIRLSCADALGKIGDPYAVAPLINVVQDEEEKSVYVRESAAAALGMLGDERAIDPLVTILETKKGFLDKFTFLKERAIEALGMLNLGTDRVFKALRHALMDESSYVRINAIEALMESGDERAYNLIKEMLGDLNEEVKKNALIALYNLSGRKILDEVIEDKNYCEFLKAEAAQMIEEYEDDNE